MLWMHIGAYEHNLRLFSAPTDSHAIHISIFDVCHSAIDINHVGE